MSFTAIDLFAGLGGFSEGAEQAGAKVLWAANHWALAVNVHQRNHPKVKHVVQDLHQANWFEVPNMDLVLASPACVPASQLIEMADGSQRRADSIKVGNLVLTHEGRGRRILNVWPKRFGQRMVTIEMWGDTKQQTRMTCDHMVFMRRRGGKFGKFGEPQWVRADELQSGDYVSFPRLAAKAGTGAKFVSSRLPARKQYAAVKYAGTDHEISRESSLPGAKVELQSSIDLWWLLGHYLGDGQARADRESQLGWSTGETAENLQRVQSILASLGLSSWVRRYGPKNATVFCSSTHLYALCTSFGRLAHLKSIPPELSRLEPELAEALLMGYFAADGNVRKIHGRDVLAATSTSLPLLQGLQRLCWNLGWSAGISIGDYARKAVILGREVNCKDSWAIYVRREPHKQSRTKFDLDAHTLWRSVKSIKTSNLTAPETVYDFEVEEDHTFCLPGVVVHNCQGHSQAATRQLARRRRGTAPRHDEYRATAWAVPSCAEVHDPPFVLVENVVDFKNWIGFKAWCGYWNDLGYSLSEHVLNAADFGVPQDRKRLFILATRGRKPLVLNPRHQERVAFKSCVDSGAANWEPVASKPPAVRARVAKGRKTFPRGMFMSQHVTGHPGRSLDRPLPTVTTKHQMALVRSGKNGDEMRMLTTDEYRCGMGFPDRYWLPDSVCDSVKLLGNAVCPPVAAALVREIMRRG